MTRAPVLAHPDAAGLFHGAPAVSFALHTAGHPAYATALARLDAHIAVLVRTRLETAHARIDTGHQPRLREFDLIRGLTGLGAYLLHRHEDSGEALLKEVLTYLVRLAEPVKADGGVLPGWWTSDDTSGRPCPLGGHGNLGLAHGIAGPLALAATATRHGIVVPGQTGMLTRVSSWLDHWRQGPAEAPWWPQTLSRTEQTQDVVTWHGPGRPSWCYGTPGLVRAQQLAALALSDTTAQRRAEQALAACLDDEAQLCQLTDASLCHGWAGLLHTARTVAADAHPDTQLSARLTALHQRLGQHLHQNGAPEAAGLLEGTTGIRLTTAEALSGTARWDACLLLAG